MDRIICMRIAVPTNDEVNIFPKMLGMADKMFIYKDRKRKNSMDFYGKASFWLLDII